MLDVYDAYLINHMIKLLLRIGINVIYNKHIF